MTESNGYPQGSVCWADLGTPDLDDAERFYGAVLGWTLERGSEEYGNYSTARRDGKGVAGVMPIQPGSQQPPAWSIYLATDDLDATVTTAREAGAQVLMEPMDVGEEGRLAVALDPTGAVFGLWQGRHHQGFELTGAPGSPCWFEVVTRDRAKADAFYGSLFDYTFEQVGDGQEFDYTVMRLGDRWVGGSMQMPASMPPDVPPHWLAYFAVADVDAAARAVTDGGGAVDQEPRDTPYGRIAAVHDPWGAHFCIMTPSGD